MNFTRNYCRKLVVRFRQAQAEVDSRPMLNSLQPLNGVDNTELSGNRLVVTYSFPETTIGSILDAINRTAGIGRQQPFNRFKNSILAFMENNERDNLTHAGGWYRYIEDIYMRHFDPGLNDRIDIRKQTWRKYN